MSEGTAHRHTKSHTYVIQVLGGREFHARDLVEHIVPHELYGEVFAPTYEKMTKSGGTWYKRNALLVPGYLYLTTDDIQPVTQLLYQVPTLTKVLHDDSGFVPLTSDEADWLDELTHPGERTVELSEGIIEGDKVTITRGPLMGHEALIAKVDRHKRVAHIRFRMLGREKLIKVGLEIVRKRS